MVVAVSISANCAAINFPSVESVSAILELAKLAYRQYEINSSIYSENLVTERSNYIARSFTIIKNFDCHRHI